MPFVVAQSRMFRVSQPSPPNRLRRSPLTLLMLQQGGLALRKLLKYIQPGTDVISGLMDTVFRVWWF